MSWDSEISGICGLPNKRLLYIHPKVSVGTLPEINAGNNVDSNYVISHRD